MTYCSLMENATTTTAQPPHLFSTPPLTAAQIAILTAPPPPFPSSSGYGDLSSLEFLLALVALITIPALIYTFIFAYGCPSRRRRPEQNSGELSIPSDDTRNDAAVSEISYRKDAHAKEIGGDCPVCLSVFADGEKLRQLSGCKHSFHADCIDLWLSNHSNCPICRASVAGKRPSSSAPVRDNDLHQGLPDASALV